MTGKAGRQRDQERAGAPARRKGEEGDRQPGRRRQRADEPQHRMHPVADAARPADRDAGQEADRGADDVAAELELDRGEDAVQQFRQIVGVDLDDGLRRREERQRQPREFRGRDFPQGQEQRRAPAATARAGCRPAPNRPSRASRATVAENAAGDDKGGNRRAMGARPVADILPPQAGHAEADPRQAGEHAGAGSAETNPQRQRLPRERRGLFRRLRQRDRLRRRIRRHRSAPRIWPYRCSA